MSLLNFHTHKRSPNAIYNLLPLELPNGDGVCSAGIHPWYLNDNLPKQREWLKKMMEHSQVKFLGEIGLDRAKEIDFKLQESLFLEQIGEYGNSHPVIIHSVRSYSDFLKHKKKYIDQKWIFHGYHSSQDMTKKLTDLGSFFSISKWVTDIPLDRLFLETDESEMDIESLYLEVATHYQIGVSALVEQINKNYQHLIK